MDEKEAEEDLEALILRTFRDVKRVVEAKEREAAQYTLKGRLAAAGGGASAPGEDGDESRQEK